MLAVAGVSGVLVYAFTRIALPEISNWTDPFILLLSLAAFFAYAGALRWTFPIRLLAVALVIPLLSWGYAYLTIPEWAADAPRIDHLARAFVFIFVAWWLGGSSRNTLTLWVVGAAGLLVTPWTLGDGWRELASGLQGEPIRLGFRNEQHTALLFGALLLGVLVFWARLVGNGSYRILRIVIGFFLLIACIFIIGATGNRAVPLAYATLALTAMVGFLWLWPTLRPIHLKGSKLDTRRVSRWSAVQILGITVTLFLGWYMVEDARTRFSQEIQILRDFQTLDLSTAPRRSIAVRAQSWSAAVEWITERPLLGWGPNGAELVLTHTDSLHPYIPENYGHLHNSYLELLSRYGVFGFSVFAILAVWFISRLIQLWKRKLIPTDFAIFYGLFFIYWAVVNVFESFLIFSTGVYLFNMVFAGLLTQIWGNDVIYQARWDPNSAADRQATRKPCMASDPTNRKGNNRISTCRKK